MEIVLEETCYFLTYGEVIHGGLGLEGSKISSNAEIKTFSDKSIFDEEVNRLKSEGKKTLIDSKIEEIDFTTKKEKNNLNRQKEQKNNPFNKNFK